MLYDGIARLVVASSISAITYAITTIAEAGDHIISASTLYENIYYLFVHTLLQYGINMRFADYRQPESFAKLLTTKPKPFCANQLVTHMKT